MKPEAIVPISAEQGTEAFATWRAKFEPRGLWTCVKRARAQEANSRFATASKSLATLRSQLEKLIDGSVEHLRLSGDVAAMQEKVTSFSVQAFAAAAGAFSTHEALTLLRDDLLRMAEALESELKDIVGAYKKMHRERGWPEPDAAYVMASCGPYQAATQFLNEHLKPALAQFEAELGNSDRGAGISPAFDPGAVSWILAGQPWRDLPLT